MTEVAVDNVSTPHDGWPSKLPPSPSQQRPPVHTAWTPVLLNGTPYENVKPNGSLEAEGDVPASNDTPVTFAEQDYLSFTLKHLKADQRWTGVIEAVHGDRLDVVLTDFFTGEEELTTLDKGQISDDDGPHAVEGAAFEWVVGHVDAPRGRRIGISMIQFSRARPLTAVEKQEALRVGDTMSRALLAGESHRQTLD